MSSQNLLNLKAELEAAKAVIEPQIEGLHDFARLNIKPETLTKVQEVTVSFERRLGVIVAGLEALANLEADKYPETPQQEVLKDIYSDLAENVSTIEAAFSKFVVKDEATTAEIVPGTPEKQP
jgi:hypothetical protein